MFRPGRANDDPTDVGEVNFDAIQVFAARDLEIEEYLAFAVQEIRDGFFFLARFYVQVNAAVLMLAKFRMKRGEQFAERFTVPCHEFSEKKRRDGSVAFGEIETEAEAATLFASNKNIVREHELTDVFEADGNFVELAIEFCGELVDKFCDGKWFCNFARKIAHPGKVPDQHGKALVWIDEGAVAVDSAKAVAVTVGGEARVIFSRDNGVAERANMRLDGFRMNVAKPRVADAVNFVAVDAVATENFGEKPGSRAVHRV